ncbi:MAG: hypothetical protein ABH950_07005 [Candidatus Altiarchaeota archaeon]
MRMLVAFLFLILISGCLGGEEGIEGKPVVSTTTSIMKTSSISSTSTTILLPNLSPKEQVEQVHIQNLKYLLEGNAEMISAAYSPDYIDLGGGPQGTGKVQHSVENFERIFSSPGFEEIQGREVEELVELEGIEIYSYEEILDSEYKDAGKIVGFQFQEGDYMVFLHGLEGSPLYDGWVGIYRLEEGGWKLIAGD